MIFKALSASGVALLCACALRSEPAPGSSEAVSRLGKSVSPAALRRDPARAREAVARELRTRPRDGALHLLTGLSYQMEGESENSLSLARVGYEAAAKFSPGHYWPEYLAGSAAFGLGDHEAAAEHFSRAILADPRRPEAFQGLAAAAYYLDELDVAQAAADRALALKPGDPDCEMTAAYIYATGGDSAGLERLIASAGTIPAGLPPSPSSIREEATRQRLRRIALAAPIADPAADASPGESPGGDLAGGSGADPSQVMIEVTVLLNQVTRADSTGINLLDGLTAQYGTTYGHSKIWLDGREGGSNVPSTETFSKAYSTIFTDELRIPDVTYSLNLFNTKKDYYRVVARPSLVAYVGQESDFFIGRTVTVAVRGEDFGKIEPIDVGISVKVTPESLTSREAKFQVAVERSFFAQESRGSFEESLTTFKQTVSATAEVEFGKTLILSGLHEGVNIGASSETPWLGSVPGLDVLFKARNNTERRDVALILVTPRHPGVIETNEPRFRAETLRRLLSVWHEYIDPGSNLESIVALLGSRHGKSRLLDPRPGDVKVPPISSPAILEPAIRETLAGL